jgi:hypothetical protein
MIKRQHREKVMLIAKCRQLSHYQVTIYGNVVNQSEDENFDPLKLENSINKEDMCFANEDSRFNDTPLFVQSRAER